MSASAATVSATPYAVFTASRPVVKPSEEADSFGPEVLVQQLMVFLLKIAPLPAARDEALRRLRIQYQLAFSPEPFDAVKERLRPWCS